MSFWINLKPIARGHFLRRVALAPLCLVLVAGLHAIRVATCNQTPWKGGGFGMFSTVDAESSRFVRAFALTDQGELPLVIPEVLSKRVLELRSAPNRAAAEELARQLSTLAWRRPDLTQASVGSRIAAAEGHEPITAAFLRPAAFPANAPLPLTGLPRGLEAIPPREPAKEAIAVHSIRVELWRMSFDRRTVKLQAEPMLLIKNAESRTGSAGASPSRPSPSRTSNPAQ